ncbi:MAG: aminopeptidase P family protein [Acidobacteriaceae bacterium]|nr:aminopeptidase P family protein [Acidobacteriaceae bacterium]
MSRRRLLETTSLLSGLMLVSRRGAGAQAEVAQDRSLPPSIAALSSMRSRVQPISTAEREMRLARAQQLMTEYHIDAIALAGGTSLAYFSGVRWGNSERMFVAVIAAKGKPFCVCPSFEEERARELLNQGPLESADVLTWYEDESPYHLLAQGLQSRKIGSGTLGIEERTPFVFADSIGQASPGLRIVSATPVTAGCRMIKSAHELQLMMVANEATLAVYKAVYAALQPGMTQTQASELIDAGYARVGFRGEASVEVGPYSALPHGSASPQVIRENAVLMIDDGCLVEGYCSDITRTFVLGKASAKMNTVFEIVHGAQKAALEAAKPGVECQAVDAAARKVVTEAGYGPGYTYFTHRVGHGIGMDGHEWPYLVRGNALKLAPGMTFSDEPGVYIRGEFGIRLEDDMHITESGAELFTPQSPSLENPFS